MIGSVDARARSTPRRAWLSQLVARSKLPEKLFVVHQFTDDMVPARRSSSSAPGLAMVLNVDGFGDQANKIAKYQRLHAATARDFRHGFKLFYEEDTDSCARAGVRLQPPPDLVVYE